MFIRDEYGNTIIHSYHSVQPPQHRPYIEHHHTECELSLLIKGSGIYSVSGREYSFSEGDVFLFGSNEAHCITEIYSDLDVLNIHFEPRILWERPDSMELLGIFVSRTKCFSNRFPKEDKLLADRIMQLERELACGKACSLVESRYLLFSILVHLIREYDTVDRTVQTYSNAASVGSLTKAVSYIDEHLSERLTLNELAEIACMSPTYFSAVFKKLNGISLWKYITIKRVERAIALLRSTDMTKLEIAENCGFSSSSNFYKAFTSITGKNPSDFSKH